MATSIGEENIELKPDKIRLKIYLVSQPNHVEGFVNIYMVTFLCLRAYRRLIGYLMLKFDLFLNVRLLSKLNIQYSIAFSFKLYFIHLFARSHIGLDIPLKKYSIVSVH